MSKEMVVIKIKSTGREYAYAAGNYSELPCVRIHDGEILDTSFSRSELKYMVDIGSAEVVGEAKITLDVSYTGSMKP